MPTISSLRQASIWLSFPRSMAFLIAALLVSPLASGCASGPSVTETYRQNRDQTVYETESMRLSKIRFSSSFNSPPRFYAIVRATCDGQNCSPDTYNMRIVADSDYPVQIGSRELLIVVDRNHFDFPAPEQDRTDRPIRVNGIITSVRLTPDQLRQIGRSSSVRGEMGSIPFQLSKRSREPIVELLVQANTSSSSSSESSR